MHRRRFLAGSVALASSGWTLAAAGSPTERADGPYRLARFRFDVTPPVGHACCGGWIKPIEAVDDPLEAAGIVLLGAGPPIVICAVDWTGILNEAHVAWREALAAAAGTTAERVAVHCVHQHNAPMACLGTQRLVAAQGDLPDVMMVDFFQQCLQRARAAITAALAAARPVTHVAVGQAEVRQVASNRRVARDAGNRVRQMRGSSCRDPELIAMPEGLIDPRLKTVALYDGQEKLAACHYYATHPMSYYGDGRASSDFVGLARKQRQQEEPGCLHLYFTGCGGNVAAGKYNDGSPEMRPLLTRRVYEGIVAAERSLAPVPIETCRWQGVQVLPPANPRFETDALQQQIADKNRSVVNRNRPAYTLALLRRLEQRVPFVISSLRINDHRVLHLPGECFVQYQLRAQRMRPSAFVATAAYGDSGPWYVPIRAEYECGGYEVSVAFCGPGIDTVLTQAMGKLLA